MVIWGTGLEFFYFGEFTLSYFMFLSQDIQVFIFLTISWFTKSTMSWWALVHKTVRFWIYLWNHNSLIHQTWPSDRHKQKQWFSRIFWTIWRTKAKFQVLFDLGTCFNNSITSHVMIPVFNFFEKVNKEHLKMVRTNY